MDTLYLVFKDRFQIVLDCPTDDQNSPQANGEFNRLLKLCQGKACCLRNYVLRRQKRRLPQPVRREKRHLKCLFISTCQCRKKRNGIIERLAKLSRAQPNNRLGRVRCSISDDIARIFLLKTSRSLQIICDECSQAVSFPSFVFQVLNDTAL